ncbi:MAG: DHH family phosphoesterase [Chthoniobacterales bacterium]
MSQNSFQEIRDAILAADRILVASHLRPDSDAIGSTLAVALWLEAEGKNVTAWNHDGLPEKFAFHPGGHLLSKAPETPQEFDLLIALDTAVVTRLGHSLKAAAGPPPIVNIDHHVSNNAYGKWNYIDSTSPATAQILFDFFEANKIPITPQIADNLFAGISTDTGSFQYNSVTPHTFRVGARLLEDGVHVSNLSQAIYESKPKRVLDLLRHALNDAVFALDDRVVSFTLPLAVSEKLKLVPEDNEGIIDHLRAVDTVIAAVFFEELPGNHVRVSARSKDLRVDVCKICQQFNGGGHSLAAGARIEGSLEHAREQFMKSLCNEVERIA